MLLLSCTFLFLLFLCEHHVIIFKVFTGKKKKANRILQPYDTKKEFLLIFFYVCWFEITASRWPLHFRVTFFFILDLQRLIESKAMSEWWVLPLVYDFRNKWQQGKSLFFINKWLACSAVKCDGIKYNKSVKMHPEFPSTSLLCP